MSEFCVKWKKIEEKGKEIEQLSAELKKIEGELEQVKSNLSALGKYKGVTSSIVSVIREINKEEKCAKSMGTKLNEIGRMYQKTEKKIVESNTTGNSGDKIWDILKQFADTASDLVGANENSALNDDDPRKKAWEDLPDELKDIIKPEDIMVADDGFIIIKPSVTELLEKAGVDEATKEKFKDYDDWYLMGIPNKDGNIVAPLSA